MRKYGAGLVLFFAATCLCLAGNKKPNPAKFMPPAESHGKAINGYGCDKQAAEASTTSTGSAFWTLIVWAQYGPDHKKYWQKSYGTYQVPLKHNVISSGESAGSGGAIGAFGMESYDFSSMDKVCADWAAQVQSTLKVKQDTGGKTQQPKMR